MKRLLAILLAVILLAASCAQPSSLLQRDEKYSDTEIFIYLSDQGYSLVKPELLWSGPASLGFGFVGASPDGSIYIAPQEYTIFRIENGEAVQAGDYTPPGFGGAWGFGFSSDGTLYFAGNVGSVGTIFKVSDARIGYDTVYYQREFKSTEPHNYIRGFAFSPNGILYFTDWTGIYKVENGVESLLYDFKTRARELNLDEMWSMAIGGDRAVHFTSNLFFRTEGGGWRGVGPAGMVLRLTREGKEQVICAAISQEARGIAIGPDNSFYILTWIGQRSSNNVMQLWKLVPEQEAVSEEPFDYQGEHVIDETKLNSDEKTALRLVQKYAKEEAVSPALLMAIIKQESDFNADAIGDAGLAIGYMQLHWDAAYDAGYRSKRDTFEAYSEESKNLAREDWPTDGLDLDANVKYGSSYFKICYDKHKDSLIYDTTLKNVISAYNFGWPFGPDKSNETSYVNPILEHYEYYKSIVQTNTNVLQWHSFVRKTRRGGCCFNVYTVTNGIVRDFREETNEREETNGLSCLISNELGSTTEVIIGIPKEAVGHSSQVRAKIDSTELDGDIIESKTMYFVVVSYPQIQDLQRLTLSW